MPSSRGRGQPSDGSGEPQARGIENGWPPNRTDGYTGRQLVLLSQDAADTGIRALRELAGVSIVNAADFEGGATPADALSGAEGIFFDRLGVAVVQSTPEQLQAAGALATADSGILAIEPEREVHALEVPTFGGVAETPVAAYSVDYLRGYRNGIDDLVDNVLGGASGLAVAEAATPRTFDESVLTWGLQVTGVAASQYTGKGVRLCILDTGYTAAHPDFVGRNIVSMSAIPGEEANRDGNGHGSHVAGTAAGPKVPHQLPRYGIAYEADLFVAKVLSNAGSGNDAGILAGLNWALTNRCQIVSMSLGAATQPGQTYSRVYETVARRALAVGMLIIAAAGNESQRPGLVAPVGHPANCPSILAVGALDQSLTTSSFSSGGLNPQGGQVDIAGPGRNIVSSWPNPPYRSLSGTSMATPHVSGIAALWLQADSDMGGGTLGWLLLQNAKRLTQLVRDVGAGLVQAP